MSRSWRVLFWSILSTNCWLKSILNASKQRISSMKAAFTARLNLVTQIMEVTYFSCWSRKSRIKTETHKKLLACSALRCTSKHLNKVIRVNSCGYSFFFCIYSLFLWASAWIITCVLLETAYLILVTFQVVAGVRSVVSSGKFYWLPPDKENTGKKGKGGGSQAKDNGLVIYGK